MDNNDLLPDDGTSTINATASESEEGPVCNQEGCGSPLEANPDLYLTLTEFGWSFQGVGGEGGRVVCLAGHGQDDPELERGLTAFLAELIPGETIEQD